MFIFIYFFIFETGSCCITLAGLELNYLDQTTELIMQNTRIHLPLFLGTGIISVCQHTKTVGSFLCVSHCGNVYPPNKYQGD